MKRLIAVLVGLLGLTAIAYGMTIVYGGQLVNESALAYNKTYTLDLNNTHIDYLAMQAVYAQASIPTIVAANTAFTIGSSVITSTNAFTTALAVLYTNTGTSIGGLSSGTTYYTSGAATGTTNSFHVSTSSANAIAGTYITITSSSSSGNYTFAPLTLTGTSGFKWEGSNDNSNWNAVALSSVTFSSPYTSASTLWDFGALTYRYIRLNITAPTTGGLNLVVNGNGKSSGSH